MLRIEKCYDSSIYTSKAFDLYFGGLSIGVLDIETTGLSPERAKLILGGLSIYDKAAHKMRFIQLFAENKDEEAALLKEYLTEISGLDILITYNGKHFDINFIQRRMELMGLSLDTLTGQACLPYNLDLYLVINGYSPLRKFLPNLKQKSVEDFMGLWSLRDDEISGAESVELYNRYLRCSAGSDERLHQEAERCRDKILLHNADDVLQLGKLIKVIEKSDFHRAMHRMGFPCGDLTVSSIEFGKNTMRIFGCQRKNPIDYISFAESDSGYSLAFDSHTREFEILLPLRRESGLAFIDLTKLFNNEYTSCSERGNADNAPIWESLTRYPSYQSGFLVLQQEQQINYLETNHFIKLFLNNLSIR